MNDLSLSNTVYNSSPESNTSISTDMYAQDFAWSSDPMLPDLYPKPKPLPIQIKKLTKEPSSAASPVDPETHRRQLDEKLAKINFDDITVAELKESLRERGLSATGRKAELLNRLKEEYDLVINQRQPHVLLNRRLDKKSSASPKLSYHPYYTPPLRHASISLGQLNHTHPSSTQRLASSLPTSTNSFLNDQFMKPISNNEPSRLRQSIDDQLDCSTTTTTTYDIWDDQMLENFLNQI